MYLTTHKTYKNLHIKNQLDRVVHIVVHYRFFLYLICLQ